jgi:PAS domain S-box-containing protein
MGVRLPSQDEDLQWRLEEAEQTLEAIRHGEVDAIVVAGPHGDLVYSLTGAEHAYRVIVETMNEAALTTDLDGTILFTNQRFCDLMRVPLCDVMGRKVVEFAAEPQRPVLEAVMAQAQAGPVQQHLALRAADGTVVPVMLSASLLRTPDSVSICLVASDLTELEESANSIRVLREHQQALQESEDRYRRFFMDDLTGDFIATPEGRIVECNPAFAEIYGFKSPADAIANGDISLFNRKDWIGVLAEVRRWGRVQRYEGHHRSHDGRDIYIVANVIGQFDEVGELTGLKGYVFDDTERKLAEIALQETNLRLENQREDVVAANEQLLTQQEELRRQAEELLEANERLQEMKEHAERTAREMEWLGRMPKENPNPVFRIALDYQILYRNAAAEELCRQWNCGQGIPAAVRDLILAARREESVGTHEFAMGGCSYLLNIAPFGSDGYVNLYVQDITARKKAEEALREMNATLENRVAQRTAELEYRARQLQKLALELSEAEEQERRRLAEVLHDDLQQQLAAVKFHLGVMGGRTKEDAATQKSIAQLDKMLRDAIETSRSLSHELSPAVIYHGDLGEILEWLANQIRAKHGLVVHVDARAEIDTESDALKAFLYKAVQEMLFNAVKHARVKEAVVRVRKRGPYISLCVSDKGRGFDMQDLRKTAGFGLMSIRERIGLLGGRMRIHSVEGVGSRFIITVPDNAMVEDRRLRTGDGQAGGRRPETGVDPAASSLQPPASPRPLRVLIADDHEIVRQGLASLLAEAQDIELVGQAGNGREAVDLAYQLRPDVVILDVAMPLMNGDEAARQIRRHLPQTRIVALSMYDEVGTTEKMRRAGVQSYILKTSPSEELLAAVRGGR